MTAKRMGIAIAAALLSLSIVCPGVEDGGSNGMYHDYAETEAFLRDLADRFPQRAEMTSIGRSHEGREIFVLKIGGSVPALEAEPNFFLVGCHHAREWISVEVCLLTAQYLLEHYADDPAAKRVVDGAQIYVLPLINPDGLEFSNRTYRWWRKNRRYNGDFSWGVDLNRNYAHQWGCDDSGSSPDPNHEAYRGSAPFSEPETEALGRFMSLHPPSGALFYHNYSQKIIYPWGYTSDPAPDQPLFATMAAEMSRRIEAVSGRMYQYGAQVLYPVNGDACDWVYATFGAPAFTIELPYEFYLEGGFFTAENEIARTFADNLPAILYFFNYLLP